MLSSTKLVWSGVVWEKRRGKGDRNRNRNGRKEEKIFISVLFISTERALVYSMSDMKKSRHRHRYRCRYRLKYYLPIGFRL